MPPTLADELRKRDAFDLPEQEAMLNIVRTAARLTEPFERLFKQHRVSVPLFNILRIVRGFGGEGTPCGEIGPLMVTPGPDVTRLVDRLETLGLAERRRSDADRRVVLVRLTSKGKRLLAKLDPLVEQQHRDSLRHLTPAELQAINDLMVKAREAPATE